MSNPNKDSYGRTLLASSVHEANHQRFLTAAAACKDDGDYEGYLDNQEQAERSLYLFQVMSARETAHRSD